MNDSNKLGGIFLVAVSAFCYGFLPIFAKLAYAAGTSTYTLLFLRFATATLVMFLIMYLRKVPLPSPKEMIAFFLLGSMGYAGQSFCYFVALNYASSGTVSLLLYTYPAMVMLGSALLFKEKITTGKLISLCFALLGAFVIIGGEFDTDVIGLVLAILSAVLYAVYILVSSRVVRPGMGTQSAAFIMFGAAVVYGVTVLLSGFEPPKEPVGFAAVILIALVSTVGSFWSFLTGMEKTGPTIASLVSTLEPLVTVIASVLILCEAVTRNLILGGCLVMASLLVTLLPQKGKKSN